MVAARPRVLIVDDNAANLLVYAAQLDDLDCELVRARSGDEALRHLLEGSFAVILLDVQMPGMDGFEVAALVREHPRTRGIPVIFVTALHPEEKHLRRAYGAGAVDLLYKPVDPYVLVSKVRVFVELHRSREALAQEIEAHKRTAAELDAFSYSVSHDLRAPLRPLAGFSRMLLDAHSEGLDDEAKHLLGRIEAAAHRMESLIESLLRLAHVGRAELRAAPFDLAAVFRAAVTEAARAEGDRAVDVVAPPELRVRADPALVTVLVDNLVRNALKFSRGRERAWVELGEQTVDGERRFYVRDHGVGFEADKAAQIFKPFRRLNPEGRFEGSGIGLAIVERVAAHHGGRVWAEGVPGVGATLWFTLG